MLAAGFCFTCKQPGHLSRNCPTTSLVKSSGSKPPRTTSFNIEPTVTGHEQDDPVEILDSLPLGAMAFGDVDLTDLDPSNKWMELTAPVILGPVDEWREEYPCWKEPGVWARRHIGDCYALVADAALTLAQPFPGDEEFDMLSIRPELRFRVVKVQDTVPEYIIHDHLTNEPVAIDKSFLEKPRFDIGRWYAKLRD